MSEFLTREPDPPRLKLQTGSIKSGALSVGRLIKQYSAGLIARETFKDLLYGYTVLLSYKKAANEESELQCLINDMAEIKARIK